MLVRTTIATVLTTFVFGALLSSSASAQQCPAGSPFAVCQTDTAQTTLPQAVGMAEWNLVTGSWGWAAATESWKDPYTGAQLDQALGFTDPNSGAMLTVPIKYGDFYSPANGYPQFVDGDAITLEGLFKWRRENIDVARDARTAPGHFSPRCGFTGEFLMMGGNCQVAFGWYNVDDPNSTTPPAPGEIVEFIPNDPTFLTCLDENGGAKTDGFCPKSWDNRSPRRLDIRPWQRVPFPSGNIATHPMYRGGDVGFAMIGTPDKGCNQSKYSMFAHNQANASGTPWVTTLIYQSTVDPEGFYLMFEDLPMAANDWHQTGTMSTNDGDFNDLVFYVSGIGCEGGGQPCDSGLQGACSIGRTDCATGAETPLCRPIIQPGTELCDNVDNNCNGVVDDGEGLCPAGLVCDKGVCVDNCTSGEFPCLPGFVCVTGACVEEICASVTCPAGQACRNGACADPCTGVTCPGKQECQLGRCVDPCASVTCPEGRVCERGLCVSNCQCRGCADGLSCEADGTCSDPACVGVMCPDGQSCYLGTCKDLCEGVTCPGGAVCSNGSCGDPSLGSGGTTGVGGISIGAGGSINFGGNSATPGDRQRRVAQDPGCACTVHGGRAPTHAWLLALLGVALLQRRARRAS